MQMKFWWWANWIFTGIQFHDFILLAKFAKIWCTRKICVFTVLKLHTSLTDGLSNLVTGGAVSHSYNTNINFRSALLFLRTCTHAPGALGGKSPGVYLEIRQICFFFKYEPERIDHDDFKDTNFVDDGQPEIAIWPPKPEVLISPKVRKISSKFWRQNLRFSISASSKSVSLVDSNNDWQPEMAAETRNTFIYETMTDSVEIPMANPVLSTITSSMKM